MWSKADCLHPKYKLISPQPCFSPSKGKQNGLHKVHCFSVLLLHFVVITIFQNTIETVGNVRQGGGSISFSIFLCCQKLLNGAIPVPGPTISTGRVESSGRWKLGALEHKPKVWSWYILEGLGEILFELLTCLIKCSLMASQRHRRLIIRASSPCQHCLNTQCYQETFGKEIHFVCGSYSSPFTPNHKSGLHELSHRTYNLMSTYILTTHGMVSPISHLFSQEEHTPSCTGPTPPVYKTLYACTVMVE